MAATPVRQVPRPQLCRMDLRQDLSPLLPASLFPPVSAPEVKEVHARHDQHLLRGLPVLRILVPLATSGQSDLGTKEKDERRTDSNRSRQKAGVNEPECQRMKMQKH